MIRDVGEHLELFTPGQLVESPAHHRRGGGTAVVLGTVEIERAGAPGAHELVELADGDRHRSLVLDGNTDGVPPLAPRAVVVGDIWKAEQILEDKPTV